MTEDELWKCKLAARKQVATDADYLAVDICELMGGEAEHEGTPERMEIFKYVWRLPRFDHPRRDRIMSARTIDELERVTGKIRQRRTSLARR